MIAILLNFWHFANQLTIHWQGGDHTRLAVPKNRTGKHRWSTDADTGDLIRALARQQPDRSIAAILNRAGKRTGKGNTWTETRVRSHRNYHNIAVYQEGEMLMLTRGELTLEQTAARLKVSKMTVLRLISNGRLQAHQACKGAPWAIPESQLSELVLAKPSQGPVTDDPDQQALDFQ